MIYNGVYQFALSDYPRISAWELKKLIAFINYEKRYGRQTEIVCDNADILAAVNDAVGYPETVKNALLPDKITECTACKHQGCLTEFVCHTAPLHAAKSILSGGKLLSAIRVTGKTGDELALEKEDSPFSIFNDPADFYEYIMFSWGNCQAGDNIAMQDYLGRFPDKNDLENNFIPGVRFYVRYKDIIQHPEFVFDGYHSAKIKDELILSDYLAACIVPEQFKSELEPLVMSSMADRTHYLPHKGLGIWDWSEKVYHFVNCLI
jgi:hypothetical protein